MMIRALKRVQGSGFRSKRTLETINPERGSLSSLRTAAFLLVTVLGAAAQNWSADVTPYLWIANVDVQTSLSGSSSPGSTERFDTRIKAGALFAGQVHYRDFGVFADFAWLRLDTEALNPHPAYSAVDLKSDFIHSTAAFTYRLPLEGKFEVEGMAGARIWYVANDLKATKGLLPDFQTSTDKTWVDPMVGARFNYKLNKNWSADLRGFVGGFGVSADITGEVFAGVTCRFTDCCSATLGYRYLYERYERAFKFELDTQGLLLGFGFHF